MKIAYKLTDQNFRTRDGYQWELNRWQETSGEGGLCSDGWLHFYTHPLLAVLLNPVHADIKNPRLFKVEVSGKFKDDNGLKVGYTKAKLIKELKLPEISLTQKIAFGILCTLEIYKEETYVKWAKNWLAGKDRSSSAATWAAADATYAAAYAAARAADAAADARAAAGKKLDLIKIAKKAVRVK